MNEPRELNASDVRAVEDLILIEHVPFDCNVIPIEDHTWAIHGRFPYEGEVSRWPSSTPTTKQSQRTRDQACGQTRAEEKGTHHELAFHARHDRPDPRLLGDAPELGALDHRLRSRGPRAGARRTPASRSRSRRSTRTRSPVEALTVPAIIEHFESVVGALDTPPILMGHSAGGAFTQVLLDHGFGAAGVA